MFCLESLLYLNMILGTRAGFNNLTSQIQTLDSNMSQFKSEIISKIEVYIGFLHIFCLIYTVLLFHQATDNLITSSLSLGPIIEENNSAQGTTFITMRVLVY